MEDSDQPSTSKHLAPHLPELDDIDLTLAIKDEEAEIKRLELPAAEWNKVNGVPGDEKMTEDEHFPKITFECESCDMKEMVHYYGKEPPFVYGLKFTEDTYVMRDPFQPPPPRRKPKPEYFVALGSKCSECRRTVCKDAACSIFYTRTFCLGCAARMGKRFPPEVNAKVRKQLAESKKGS